MSPVQHVQGLLLIKGARGPAKGLLERLDINNFLRKAQKSVHFKERIIEKLSHLLGLLLVEEEDRASALKEHTSRRDALEHANRKVQSLQDRLQAEEEAKRRTLLRYVDAVKKAAEANAAAAELGAVDQEVVRRGAVVQLAEAGIGDEEMHALAALLRGNDTITELVLRANSVTDEGVRALAAVLAGPSALRVIDLRNNHVGRGGLRALSEGLERSERVNHVYVHAGGKIDALGAGLWAAPRGSAGAVGDLGGSAAGGGMATVETVCAIDVRNNTEPPRDDVLDLPPASELSAPRGGGGGGMSATAPSTDAAGAGSGTGASGYRGPSSPSRKTSGGGGGASGASGSRRRSDKGDAETRRRRDAADTKRRAKMEADRLAKERREANWSGRAGGLDVPTEHQRHLKSQGGDSGRDSGGLPSIRSASTLPTASHK